jgi:hypothetical protein
MVPILSRLSMITFAAVLLQSTCNVAPLPDGSNGDNGSDGNGSSVASDRVRVRFVNRTTWALDVQFYAAPETGDPATALFIEANRITTDIGFAGSGLLPVLDTDEILLDCANAQMIGTLGGEFLDPETGEASGTGQQRSLTIDQQFTCQETITFIYKMDGETFQTSILVD